MYEDNGNKCGKCQNHEFEVLKKGHARDCPYKKCNCLKCRLLDARSDILQVISGKETKLKGTKKDPNCGFCQNHGVKILRKGHVRSCGFGQERHFKLDNCFDCEVHYIRNEVNRLQIKMRRAMKEDRTLSEEQRKTAREAITRDEVEKVCDMARLARKKRENILTQQSAAGGETSSPAATMQQQQQQQQVNSTVAAAATASGLGGHLLGLPSNSMAPLPIIVPKVEHTTIPTMANITTAAAAANTTTNNRHQNNNNNNNHLNQLARQTGVWRPWSQHQVAAAMAAQQQQQHQHHLVASPNNQFTTNHNHSHLQHEYPNHHQQPQAHQQQTGRRHLVNTHSHAARNLGLDSGAGSRASSAISIQQQQQQANNMNATIINDQQHQHHHQQQQLTSAITSMAMANQTYLMNSLQQATTSQQQQQQPGRGSILSLNQQQYDEPLMQHNSFDLDQNQLLIVGRSSSSSTTTFNQFSPPSTPPPPYANHNHDHIHNFNQNQNNQTEQPLQLTHGNMQQDQQQIFNTLFRILVAQFAGVAGQPAPGNPLGGGSGSNGGGV